MKGSKHMKKIIKRWIFAFLMLTLLFAFVGCGEKIEVEVDFDAVIAANATDALVERFGSVVVEVKDYERSFSYYADSRFVYTHSDAYTDYDDYEYPAYGEIVTDTFCGGYEKEKYYSVVYAGMDVDTEWSENLIITPEIFENETLISSREENGFIIFKTRLDEAKMIELGYWAESDFEDCYYLTEYKIDKATNVIYEMEETFVYGVGILNRSTVEYKLNIRAEAPEEASNIYSHITEAAETCKATVVYDPDTAEEKSFTVTVPKGDILYFYWADAEEYPNAFSDRACTKPFAYTAVANEDIEIYVTK